MTTPPPSLVAPSTIEAMCDIAHNAPEGCFVEFGVYKGGTAWYLAQIAREQRRALYLYDTFTGIPFKGPFDQHAPGDFGDVDVEEVRAAIPEAVFCVGLFPDTLIQMPPIAFVHVDADQYQSLKDAIRIFPPLMVSGATIIFDDPGCLESADKAIAEWEAELGYKLGKTVRGKTMWVKP